MSKWHKYVIFQRVFKKQNGHLFYKISPFCIWKGEKPIFTIKHWFYSQNRIFALPDAKEENFIKQKAFFFLNSLWNITFYCHFDNKMPQKVFCLLIFPSSQTQLYIVKKLQIAFFQKSLERFFLNSRFKLSTCHFKKVIKVIFHAHFFFPRCNQG